MTITPQEHTKDMRDKFNKYCAEVMGYKETEAPHFFDSGLYVTQSNGANLWLYNPYDDLNQMAEVFDVLWNRCRTSKSYITKCLSFSPKGNCKQAFQDFIESTMPISTRGKE